MTQLDWFFTAVAILATPAFIAFVVWHYRHKRKHIVRLTYKQT